jgi:hypothetical protein
MSASSKLRPFDWASQSGSSLSRIELFSALPLLLGRSDRVWQACDVPATIQASSCSVDYALDMRELDLFRLADKLKRQANQTRIT